ncbi:MAG: hypothetical protein LBK58_05425 [Prevotellaceae bacterium]|jgi:hypothetical protein|nr:hypothetical protein [Prevotellaceae bacterium]
MERTLELRDIAGNISHDLHITTDRTAGTHPVYCAGKERLYVTGFERGINIKFCKAVMRPLSDLNRTVTHNGKEIIPIVECAKIAEPDYDWKINRKMAKREIIYETWTDKVFFGYTGLHRYFKFTEKDDRYFYSVYQNDNMEYIPDQVPLFDYLHELKIDYRGLIDSGLAIDANKLEINPYK